MAYIREEANKCVSTVFTLIYELRKGEFYHGMQVNLPVQYPASQENLKGIADICQILASSLQRYKNRYKVLYISVILR